MLLFNTIHKNKEVAQVDADTTKSLRINASITLNMPEPLVVEENAVGLPTTVTLKRRQPIITIEDCWRIDDEWWRSEPVSRMYYAVMLDSGRKLVLCKDLINKRWFQQSYL
jgi:hypothetical protein